MKGEKIRKSSPTLIVFAGANGAGKTTLAEQFLPYVKIKEFVNADEIAKGLSPFNPTGQKLLAGKLLIGRVENLVSRRESFAIETTLSGNTLMRVLMSAKAQGYYIKMYYIYTSNVDINLRRIENRVRQGGHSVPIMDVRRRYKRSIQNFFYRYFTLCDMIGIYDGSSEIPTFVGVKQNGTLKILKSSLLTWAHMQKIAGIIK